MAEVMPINFPLPSEKAAVTYSYEDLVNGLGYSTFYCGVTDDGNYILTPFPFIASTRSGVQYSDVENTTITFVSSTFNTPRIMKGKALIKYGMSTSAGAGTRSMNLIIYKNTTALVTQAITVPQANEGYYLTTEVTIPETVIGIGDVIKVEFAPTGAGPLYLAHDPSDEFDGTIGALSTVHSSLKCEIPFKIEN